jgi:NAD(P)-dependent dehydrogenase (short-subunit alcohol dehydrogenase family)
MDTRVALITGAASGLGRGLALALARQGWRIAALDVNEAGLQTLAAEVPACATAVADVTQPDALAAAIQDLERRLGPTDLLVASAGIGLETSAHALKPQDIAAVINVNLLGVVHSVAAVLPGMLGRRRGHLVALSSVASFRGLPRMLAYCASKSGVNAFMEGIRAEIRGHGVLVTTICPSWVRTPMTASLQDRLHGILELDDAVREMMWAIERKRPFHAFPRRTVWQLRFLSWLPRSWQDASLARMSRKIGKGDRPV